MGTSASGACFDSAPRRSIATVRGWLDVPIRVGERGERGECEARLAISNLALVVPTSSCSSPVGDTSSLPIADDEPRGERGGEPRGERGGEPIGEKWARGDARAGESEREPARVDGEDECGERGVLGDGGEGERSCSGERERAVDARELRREKWAPSKPGSAGCATVGGRGSVRSQYQSPPLSMSLACWPTGPPLHGLRGEFRCDGPRLTCS